jgi:hypothetical protein
MSSEARHCPICNDLLVEVEAALNRTWGNVIATGFGSSVLDQKWQGRLDALHDSGSQRQGALLYQVWFVDHCADTD